MPARLPLAPPESLAELYHENTKVRPYEGEGEREREGGAGGGGGPYPPAESLRYGGAIPLPPARELSMRLDRAMLARRSRREMTGAPMAIADASTLLRYAYGLTSDEGFRAAPSAGARYPLDLFVAAQRLDGLAPGVWHYRPEDHAIEPVRKGDPTATLARAFLGQDWIERTSMVVLVGGTLSRTSVKYGERGYRLMLLDAGHAMQNLLLSATAMELQASALGGFLDDELNDLCTLDGVDQNVVYAVAVGR